MMQYGLCLIFCRRKNDRESKVLSSEAERQSKACHVMEADLHRMEKEEMGLLSSLRDKERFEEEVSRMQEEITSFLAQSKASYPRRYSLPYTDTFLFDRK